MAKFKKNDDPHGPDFIFDCPGCKCSHGVWTTRIDGYNKSGFTAVWEFNGDVDKPTVTPSLLVRDMRHDHMIRCHSYITNGMIQYLDDTTHELKNQTIELPEYE